MRTTFSIAAVLFLFYCFSGCGPEPNPVAPVQSQSAKIVFSSNRDGDNEIFIMDTNGSNLQQLTNNQVSDQMPSLSPEGDQIVFVSNRYGIQDTTFSIFKMQPDGQTCIQLTSGFFDYCPAWSPDGNFIAFSRKINGGMQLFIMGKDGANIRQVTSSVDSGTYEVAPSWFNANTIVFNKIQVGNSSFLAQICSIDKGGTSLKVLSASDQKLDWYPACLSNKIYFSSDRDGDYEIFSMDASGGNVVQLTNNIGYDGQPRCLAGIDKVFFISGRTGTNKIFSMNPDGGSQIQLTNGIGTDEFLFEED